MKALVLGAGGQLGRAVMGVLPDAAGLSHDQLDITRVDPSNCDWRGFDVVINCAAWTDVDAAETLRDAGLHGTRMQEARLRSRTSAPRRAC